MKLNQNYEDMKKQLCILPLTISLNIFYALFLLACFSIYVMFKKTF